MRQKIDIYLDNVNKAKEAGITFHAKNQGPIWKSMDEFAVEMLTWLEVTGQIHAGYTPEVLLAYYKNNLANQILIRRALNI